MEVRADLHTHLSTFEGDYDFNRVVDIARANLDEGGIVGVTCFMDNRYERLVNSRGYEREKSERGVYVPSKDILFVKSQEVFTDKGHLVAVGLPEKKLIRSRTIEDVSKEAVDNGASLIGAHIFFKWGIGPFLRENPGLLKYLSAFEIGNGESFSGNREARRFYEEIKEDYDIGALSSSDGHYLFEIGKNNSLIELPCFGLQSIESLDRAVRAHKDYSKDSIHYSLSGSLCHTASLGRRIILRKLGFKVRMGWDTSNKNI